MSDKGIERLDVVQIAPEAKCLEVLRGAYATVTHVKSWGVRAMVHAMYSPYVVHTKDSGRAHVRLEWGDFEKIGRCAFHPSGEL